MTSEFDTLMTIWYFAEQNPKYEKIALWLADVCVKEAERHRQDWNFSNWLNSYESKLKRHLYGEKWLKFVFLDRTHDVLDHHGGLHGRVFSRETWELIRLVEEAVMGSKQLYVLGMVNVKKLKKKFPELDQHLSELGYVWKDDYACWLKSDKEGES